MNPSSPALESDQRNEQSSQKMYHFPDRSLGVCFDHAAGSAVAAADDYGLVSKQQVNAKMEWFVYLDYIKRCSKYSDGYGKYSVKGQVLEFPVIYNSISSDID